MLTGRKTVIPPTPETETQGYVTYQIQRLCSTTFPNTEKEVDNMAHRGVFVVKFLGFRKCGKTRLNCFVYFPN